MYVLLTIETLAFWKVPRDKTSQFFTPVNSYVWLRVKWQMDEDDSKSQLSGFAAYFMLNTPLAHAALADNQNTATMTVKQKS